MQRNVAARSSDVRPGVIDSLADGLTLALARPWLLLAPMLLDLYYWVGWKVTLESLASPVKHWVLRQDQAESADVAKGIASLGRADSTQLLALFTPSLLAWSPREDVYSFVERSGLSPEHWAFALSLVVVFLIGACLLHAIYAIPLSDAAIDRIRTPRTTLRAILLAWLRVMGLNCAAIGIAMLLLGPAMIASLALILAGIDPSPLLGIAFVCCAAAGFLVWWFAMKAIAVSDVGPFRAIRYAFAVVRGFLWQSIGFVSAWLLLGAGLGRLWLEIAGTAPGLLVGVIANAFFATGVALAGMIFYRARIGPLVSEPALRHSG